MTPRASHSFIAVTITFLLLGLAASAHGAAVPWLGKEAFSVEAGALLDGASSLGPEEGADVQVFLREGIYRFDEEGRCSVEQRLVYKILTPAGLDAWATQARTWSPWHQERPRFRSRVITPDGVEHWLDPATIDESPVADESRSVMSDRLILRAPLPAVTEGALVEEWSELRDEAPLFDQGIVQTFSFAMQVPVYRTRLVLEAPRSLPLRHVARLLPDVEPIRTEDGDRVRWIFEAGETEVPDSVEPFTPGNVPVWPYVSFSTGSSWAQVARRYSGIVDAAIGEPGLADLADQATAGAGNRRERIAALLAWVHEEIRYTGLELGEGAIVPRSPAETMKRKYGDCKDESTLLVALLRAAGIPAHVALLSIGPGIDVEPELPGLGAFDHAIVYVPGEDGGSGGAAWIDPTHEFAAAGELPLVDQDRLALIAGPEAADLVRTPAAGSADNRTVETREVFLAADLGSGRIVETSDSWGSISQDLRQSYGASEPDDVKTSFEDYVEAQYGAEELLDWQMSDPRDLSGPFRIRLEAGHAAIAQVDLHEAAVAIRPSFLLGRLPRFVFDDEEPEPGEDQGSSEVTGSGRRSDLALLEPHVAEWHYRIVPPAGYRPYSLPEPEVRHLGPATLAREVAEHDGEVSLTLRFDTVQRRFTPDEYEALRRSAAELVEEAPLLVTFEQVGERHLAAGEIRAALAEFDRLVAADPKRALPHVRRALALLEAGLGKAARQEIRTAIDLEPDFYVSHQVAGWIFQHDLIGRRFRAGFDHDAAVEAYRRSLELEPSAEISRMNLAILLEHDGEGHRYSSGAKLDEAIAEYRTLLEDSDDADLRNNLMVALARADRFQECLELIDELEDSPMRQAYKLVAMAVTAGPGEALAESLRIVDGGERRQALATAGWALAQLRRYAESTELMAAAAKGAPDPTQALSLAELLKKTRRHEELGHDEHDPKSLVPRLMIASLTSNEEDLRALFSRRISAEATQQEIEGAAGMVRAARTAARTFETPIETFLDLGLAGVRLTQSGDDGTGYRFRVTWNVNGVNTESSLFAVAEGGGYRILAGEQLPSLGSETLQLLAEGRLDAARVWLDWARDLTTAPSAEDPYAGEPFFRFWRRRSPGGAEEIRAAAASLVAGGSDAGTAIPILTEGRDRAAAGDERRRFEMALARAYVTLERQEDVAELVRPWLAEVPDSKTAFAYLAGALSRLQRWDELERAARERLDVLPDDRFALIALANMAQLRDDLARSVEIYEHLVALGEADSHVYNGIAWNTVVLGKVDDTTIAHAQQSVAMTGGVGTAQLHTLATVYAELGKNTEAREVLLKSIDLGATGEPSSDDWYVLGRIAENYGAIDAAKEAYGRVDPPEDTSSMPASTYRLARRRLDGLAGEKPGPGGGARGDGGVAAGATGVPGRPGRRPASGLRRSPQSENRQIRSKTQ